MTVSHLPRLLAGTLAVSALAGLVACTEPTTSGAQFCAALDEQMPVLTTKVTDQLAVDALVATYVDLDERTPLAIEESWHQLTVLVQTAATVVASDPESVQTVADAAYATERSARDVATWVAQTCGFSMPEMAGVEGPVTTPPTTD